MVEYSNRRLRVLFGDYRIDVWTDGRVRCNVDGAISGRVENLFKTWLLYFRDMLMNRVISYYCAGYTKLDYANNWEVIVESNKIQAIYVKSGYYIKFVWIGSRFLFEYGRGRSYIVRFEDVAEGVPIELFNSVGYVACDAAGKIYISKGDLYFSVGDDSLFKLTIDGFERLYEKPIFLYFSSLGNLEAFDVWFYNMLKKNVASVDLDDYGYYVVKVGVWEYYFSSEVDFVNVGFTSDDFLFRLGRELVTMAARGNGLYTGFGFDYKSRLKKLIMGDKSLIKMIRYLIF